MPKHPGGRPPAYKSKKELEEKIEAYFRECEGVPFFDENGYPMRTNKGCILYEKAPKPPTITGLALALGFTSRQALLNYQAKKEFFDTITRAKSRVEEYAETRLYDRDGVNGAKFNLANNFRGWRDKPVYNLMIGELTAEQIKIRLGSAYPVRDELELEALEKLDSILEGIDRAAERQTKGILETGEQPMEY